MKASCFAGDGNRDILSLRFMNNLFINHRDFIRELRLCGFILVPGKGTGSHQFFRLPGVGGGITVSRKKKNVCKKSVSDARKFVRLHLL